MSENPSYYAIIPAFVRYSKELKANEKLLYGEITCLSNKTWECFASNAYFANLYGVSDRQVREWIRRLHEYWFINVKIEKNEWNKRYISIIQTEEKFHTLRKKSSIPSGRKSPDPMEENFLYNNTSDNTKKNNTINILNKINEFKKWYWLHYYYNK